MKKYIALLLAAVFSISLIPSTAARAAKTTYVGCLDVEGYVKTVYMTPDQAEFLSGDPDNVEVMVIKKDNAIQVGWKRYGWDPDDFDWDAPDSDGIFFDAVFPPSCYHQVVDYVDGEMEVVNFSEVYANPTLKGAGIFWDYDSYDDIKNEDYGTSGYDFWHSAIFSITLNNAVRGDFQDQYFIFEDMVEDHILQFTETPTAGEIVYRLYNPYTGEHFFTTNTSERRDYLKGGWIEEDSPGRSMKYGVPVYRLVNILTNERLYTADPAEYRKITKLGWKMENDGKPVFFGTNDGGKSIYRVYNPNSPNLLASHHYTSNKGEIKTLTTKKGWQNDNGGKAVFAFL